MLGSRDANLPAEAATLALLHRLSRFLTERIGIGDRLGEAFYAVWMAVVSIGLLNSVAVITPDHLAWVIVTAFGVNLTWGIIDGVTAMYTYILERAGRDGIVRDLKDGNGEARERAKEALADTIAAGLDAAALDRLIGEIAARGPPPGPAERGYRPDRDDWLFALGIVAIDVGLVIPVVLPLVLIDDIAAGVYVSRLVATAMFTAIGWAYARNLGHRPWLAAGLLGVLGFAVFTIAYETGG